MLAFSDEPRQIDAWLVLFCEMWVEGWFGRLGEIGRSLLWDWFFCVGNGIMFHFFFHGLYRGFGFIRFVADMLRLDIFR